MAVDRKLKSHIKLDETTQARIIEKAKLTPEERFALDAYIVSSESKMFKLELAYKLSRKIESKAKPQSLEIQMYRWLSTLPVQHYIEDKEIELFGYIRKEDREGSIEDRANSNVIRSKDETIEELNHLANSTQDIKLKGEFLMKIADLQNWKKKEEEDKESRITYFAPLKCSQCPIKMSATLSKDNK